MSGYRGPGGSTSARTKNGTFGGGMASSIVYRMGKGDGSMFKNCAKWISAAALAWTVGTAPAAAATYVKPNHGYDLNPVPA